MDRYGVQIIGVKADTVERGEDHQAFKDTMNQLGIDMPRSWIANSLEEAEKTLRKIGLIKNRETRIETIRPAYTLGTTGGGLVYNIEQFRTALERGLSFSLVGQVLIEESVLGWEEPELEVVRDAKNQKITVFEKRETRVEQPVFPSRWFRPCLQVA